MYLMRLLRFGRKVELMNIKDGIFINICLTQSAFFVLQLKEAVRQSRLTLEDIPMNAQFIDSALDTNHGCFRVNLHGTVSYLWWQLFEYFRGQTPNEAFYLSIFPVAGSEDQFKIIHPFDLVLMVFTPQVPGTSSGPPRKLFAFGVVQSCKLREGNFFKMRISFLTFIGNME